MKKAKSLVNRLVVESGGVVVVVGGLVGCGRSGGASCMVELGGWWCLVGGVWLVVFGWWFLLVWVVVVWWSWWYLGVGDGGEGECTWDGSFIAWLPGFASWILTP